MRRRFRTLHLLVIFEAIALIIILVVGLVKGRPTLVQKEIIDSVNVENEISSVDPMADTLESTEETEEIEETNPIDRPTFFSQAVKDYVSELSIEQKISQMILTTQDTLTGIDDVKISGKTTDKAFKSYPIGGLIYTKNNYENKNQFKVLVGKTNNYYGVTAKTNLLFFANVGETDSPQYIYANKFDVVAFSELLNEEESTTEDSESISKLQTFVNGYGDAHDTDKCILVTSEAAAQKLSDLGYGGVIIGSGDNYSALVAAGCDMVIVKENLDGAIQNIIEGISSGLYEESKIDDAISRVLTVKEGLADTGLEPITTTIVSTKSQTNTNNNAAQSQQQQSTPAAP